MKQVSIIIPTYNRGHCIDNAIRSALEQTFTDFELIICDDCSTDNTEQVVKGFTDKRILYVKNSVNLGLPANRNVGLSLSKSPLVIFWEDDILFDKDGLEVLVKTFNDLERFKIGAISPKVIEDSKNGKLLKLETMVADNVRSKLKKPSYISKWTGLIFRNLKYDTDDVVETELVNPWSLYNREAIKEVGGFSKWFGRWVGYSHEETDLFVRMSKRGYKLFYQSKSVSYHKHTNKGGTRVNQLRYSWNYFGAHIIFLVKEYGFKAIYMFPLFVLYVFLNVIRYFPRMVKRV